MVYMVIHFLGRVEKPTNSTHVILWHESLKWTHKCTLSMVQNVLISLNKPSTLQCILHAVCRTCSTHPFYSAQQVKEIFKLVEHFRASSLILSAHCIILNIHSPHFSPLHTDSSGGEPGIKMNVNIHIFYQLNLQQFQAN